MRSSQYRARQACSRLMVDHTLPSSCHANNWKTLRVVVMGFSVRVCGCACMCVMLTQEYSGAHTRGRGRKKMSDVFTCCSPPYYFEAGSLPELETCLFG